VTETASQPTNSSGGRRWLALLFGTRPTARAVDLALVAVRVALAWIFFVYGAQKLFGWFNGAGIDGTADFMANGAGLKPGHFFAVLGGIIEFGGAIAIVLGLVTRLAGLALFGDMVMAMITITWAHGLHQATSPGYELNVALAALALVVTLLGAGRYSVDALVEPTFSPANDPTGEFARTTSRT
jgi:putative oxidoreductase